MRWMRVIAGAVAMLLMANSAYSAINLVTPTPSTIRLNSQGGAVITVRWAARSVFPGQRTISSSVGELRVNGVVVATPGRALSRQVSGNVATARFTERIRVSRTIAKQLAAGAAVEYRRRFTDGTPDTMANAATFRLSSSGALSLSNLTLRFDDETQYRVVRESAPLTARARVNTIGRGVFEGTWEVAGPSDASGGAFRPIARERKVLAGSRATVFESPALPTDRPGLYAVRFVPVRDPFDRELSESFVALRYAVAPGGEVVVVGLRGPGPGAALTSSTRFSWSPMRGASTYRLEFHRQSVGRASVKTRVAAVEVGGGVVGTRLRPFTVARIERGRAAYWRVVAYDSEGTAIGASPLRSFGVARK